MIRRFIGIATFLCCAGLSAAAPVRAAQATAAGPVCLYQGKSFSDGAFVCVQKSLMQNCATEGTRAIWRIVADRELSERCVAPTVIIYPPVPRRHARRMWASRRAMAPAREASAKCFSFNGRQYCE